MASSSVMVKHASLLETYYRVTMAASAPTMLDRSYARRKQMNAEPMVRAACWMLVAAWLTACSSDPRDSRLEIPINALCTTCNDFIRCDRAEVPDNPIADTGTTLYHLRPKGFFAQIATILDYLLQAFRDREADHRPLTVYRGATARESEAVTDLRQHRISVPDGWIDQANGAWYDGTEAIGRCRLLPLADGRNLLQEFRGGDEQIP
jgi:hypothetical protein